MKTPMWRSISFLLALSLVLEISAQRYDTKYKYDPYTMDNNIPKIRLFDTPDEEYTKHVHSLFDAYRGDYSDRMVVETETDTLIGTTYRTWKRNADLINSLLALPKGMNDAGR
ncbi:uncharacterized protein LOC126367699 [Pectinophora gossypiella]|uniref:uncharacterized protein LOC126367699 n=1 Tax=Pectinophora gossypiella TaxID=13191 RepID=UPI00214F3254|nr:uncharacterized protein LOC126367699 [Pectinophora gossypiella]XP_049867315.1 uncharacterized protein LOC126367699 [Pectinophora gossypiella]